MDSILVILFVSLAIASVMNIVFKKLSVSHIVGYIVTGTIVSYVFDMNENHDLHALDMIGEFGIVFLMFTIGLEMSFSRLRKLKEEIFVNGFIQVAVSAVIIFIVAVGVFSINYITSIVIALAFSLSSTAIVLTYMKKSKDVVTPYGEKTVAILIFQDIAVIPILLLISFLSVQDMSMGDVLIKTVVSAVLVIVFMFTLGKMMIAGLLSFSSSARLEELFLGSVLTIVMGASLLSHSMGFTYSLGAFIAGMIIAETDFHVKVESDIASYKDLLLGAFFFSIGIKIDMFYFVTHVHWVLGALLGVMLIKGLVVYGLISRRSNRSDSIKAAFALCQVGEFSFAIYALALHGEIVSEALGSFLILVTVLSMIITPFMVNNIYKFASLFVEEFYESDKITPIETRGHTVICGFSTVGQWVAKELDAQGKAFVIISDNLTHVLNARAKGYMAYFGHLDKTPVLESLHVEASSSVIITVNTSINKRILCEAVLAYYPGANLVVRIDTPQERRFLSRLGIRHLVNVHRETAERLVRESVAQDSGFQKNRSSSVACDKQKVSSPSMS